jgi:hypothetical protein
VSERIPWILDPHGIARCEDDPNGDVDRLLGAGGHDYLFGFAAHGPSRAQVFRDLAAQLDESTGVGIAQVIHAQRAHGPVREPAPVFVCPRINQRSTRIEWQVSVLHRCAFESGSGTGEIGQRPSAPPATAPVARFGELGKIARYIGTRTGTRLGIPLGE